MQAVTDKKQQKHYRDKEQWERDIDNFDRSERRREKRWRKHVVRVDSALISQLTDNRGKLHLDRLNELERDAEY